MLRDGRQAVLADRSTDGPESIRDREGGEPRSKGPTQGKERPGITSTGRKYERYSGGLLGPQIGLIFDVDYATVSQKKKRLHEKVNKRLKGAGAVEAIRVDIVDMKDLTQNAMKTVVLALLSLVLFAVSARAESIYLKDGKIVRGTITEEDDKTILLETNDTWQKIEKTAIEFIRKDGRQRGEPAGMNDGIAKDVSVLSEKKPVESKKWETVLKIAGDIMGRNSFSKVSITGSDSFHRGDTTIGAGMTLTGEEIYYPRPAIGLGAGISFQTTRHEPASGGHFNFIPIYGLVRIRSTPAGDSGYSFAAAHLGYNYFNADRTYAGAGKYEMTNGAYAGLGAGYVFGRVQGEILYTVDRGRLSSNGYDSLDAPYSISAEAAYSKICLSFGVIF